MKVDLYSKKGKKLASKIELNDKVFSIKPNEHSVYLAIKSELRILNSFSERLKPSCL